MTRSHYVLDLYLETGRTLDRFRREVVRLTAANDEEAITEGHRVNAWRKGEFFQIRLIKSALRTADRLVYSSRSDLPEDHVSPPTLNVAAVGGFSIPPASARP